MRTIMYNGKEYFDVLGYAKKENISRIRVYKLIEDEMIPYMVDNEKIRRTFLIPVEFERIPGKRWNGSKKTEKKPKVKPMNGRNTKRGHLG